jgi:hypothetical protein
MEAIALTHPLLMRESERRIASAVGSRDPRESTVARRLLADGAVLRLWDIEHARYMRVIARERRRPGQLTALRGVSFGLIHRKALFEYLRSERPRGDERRRIVALFHRSLAHSTALVWEHHEFVRASCSMLCTNHIATSLLEERAFDEAFCEYERLFAEYFRLFCSAGDAGVESADPCRALLPLLKHELSELRRLMMAGSDALAAAQRARRLLLSATGDTVRLPALR